LNGSKAEMAKAKMRSRNSIPNAKPSIPLAKLGIEELGFAIWAHEHPSDPKAPKSGDETVFGF
jgi:hypothetical protein